MCRALAVPQSESNAESNNLTSDHWVSDLPNKSPTVGLRIHYTTALLNNLQCAISNLKIISCLPVSSRKIWTKCTDTVN